MKTFDEHNLIDLDDCLLNALELFAEKGVPELNLPPFERPLVVGSGNAAVTGRIVFEGSDAVFADESTYERALDAIPAIDGGILFSASGGKHAPLIGAELKRRSKHVVLVTNNAEAPARAHADTVVVLPKNPEPYTYNTSTYLGILLAHTREDPQAIRDFITSRVDPLVPSDLDCCDAWCILVSNRFANIREMFLTKFDELFGAMVSGRVFTTDQVKHAKTVVPSGTELFVSLGEPNETFGLRRLSVPLPENANFAAIMAIGYYLIGKLQRQHPPYFKSHISAYLANASPVFGEKLSVIVP